MISLASVDGFFDSLICGVFIETEYAKGYSLSKFQRVHVGQSKHEVRELLGEPLSQFYKRGESRTQFYTWGTQETRGKEFEFWCYSSAGPPDPGVDECGEDRTRDELRCATVTEKCE